MDAPPTTTTAAETAIRAMEKPTQDQIQQQQQPLKCPRCESTNTKFCYYNNYSLSQPRHFCKACKRYWTRGGTLRNVPVGGGCRKNKHKRVRTLNSNNSSNSSATSNNSSQQHNTFTSQSLNPNPMLFGFPTSLHVPHHSSHDAMTNDFQFSGFETHPQQILQDLFSNSNPSLVSPMSMSSLLCSSLQQHKFHFQNPSLTACQSDLQMKRVGSHGSEGAYNLKNDNVKSEDDGTHNRHQQSVVNYEIHGDHQQSPMEASDPSILWSNSSNNGASIGGNWLDPNFSSVGSSSIPSLI